MKKNLLLLSFFATFFISFELKAQSYMSLSAGGYSFNASGGTKSVSKSGPGAYRVSYAKRFYKGFHFNAGYNLIFESGFAGDQSYGLDIGVSWFFLNETLRQNSYLGDVNLSIESSWSPYAGLSFNQRSYQSSKTNYSGVGLNAGVLFPFLKKMAYLAELRWNKLTGPNQSTVDEKAILMGVAYYF